MTDLEKKEIRGVTLKLVWTIVISAGSCIMVGVGLYNNIISEIRDNKSDYKLTNQHVDFLEKRVTKAENDIEILKYKTNPPIQTIK
ncbi:hypothetical protein JST56_07060 [Candidatus Dependentiae bacterium]|nr:hypothetical protein [Candidatus Dependentiae bacterium]